MKNLVFLVGGKYSKKKKMTCIQPPWLSGYDRWLISTEKTVRALVQLTPAMFSSVCAVEYWVVIFSKGSGHYHLYAKKNPRRRMSFLKLVQG